MKAIIMIDLVTIKYEVCKLYEQSERQQLGYYTDKKEGGYEWCMKNKE